jgi:ribosome-binding protein aMBF1 (putative translation factor)
MLIGVQIRAARSALNWSAETLAQKVNIATKTVRRIENAEGVPQTTAATLLAIQSALEAAGIEFIGTPDDGPGIRIHRKPAPPA